MRGMYPTVLPERRGLYDPSLERDACGVGFVARVSGEPSHSVVTAGIQVLLSLAHRGAVGSDGQSGDGAGILVQVPDAFFRREARRLGFALPAPGAYAV